MELTSELLSPNSKKIKKIHPEKNSYISREWNFLAGELKNSLYFKKQNFLALILRSLYFLKRKLFYISGNETFLYFRKRKPRKNPSISGNRTFTFRKMETPEKVLIFQETATGNPNFTGSKNKKKPLLKNISYLGKWNFLAPSLKTPFLGRTSQDFSSLFLQGFSFFTADFYHCFSSVFIVDCIFSCHQLCCFFVRYFVLVLYRECYGFERAFFFYSQAFFTLNPFPTFATVPRVLRI